MRVVVLLCLSLLNPSVIFGQVPSEDPTRSLASRRQLQSELSALEQTALQAAGDDERDLARTQAATIRRRLAEGDFRVGDRIALHVLGDTALSDTLVVQAGQRVVLPGLADVSLEGVLRSELPDRVTAALKRFLRDPKVRTESLLRVGISGDVGRPGFYSVPFEALLSDLVMVAGGGTGSTDLRRITIRRGEQILFDEKGTLAAIQRGYTLDQLDLRVGDEVNVGSRQERNWGLILGIAGTLLGVATFVATLGNR